MGNFEYVKHKNPEQVSFPVKKSSGPSLGVARANSTASSPESCSRQDQSLILKTHVAHGPQLVDISNSQQTRHASLALGPKWSHVLRSSPGSKEALLSHARQKIGFVVDSNQLELPNKKV